jgi:hypothetical protein
MALAGNFGTRSTYTFQAASDDRDVDQINGILGLSRTGRAVFVRKRPISVKQQGSSSSKPILAIGHLRTNSSPQRVASDQEIFLFAQ